MRLIGLAGRKGAGKNHVADLIIQCVKPASARTDAFARPLKDFAIDALGLDPALIHGSDDDRNTPTRFRWEDMPGFVREANPGKNGDMTVREVMQILGTELGRRLWGEDVWVRAMASRVSHADEDYFLITDVRFPNEARAIKAWGGEVWMVVGPRGAGDPHVSERMLGSVGYDRLVDNDHARGADCLAGVMAALRAAGVGT